MLKARKFFCAVMMFSFFASLLISKVVSAEVPKISPVILHEVKHDTSPPLMLIQPIEPKAVETIQEIPLFPLPKAQEYAPLTKLQETDPVLQYGHGSLYMPATIQNFEGVNNRNAVLPPDTNGDVGPNHYVQMINISFAIWDKSGTLLYGPVNNNTLWSGFGGPCETNNHGDPIVLYDRQADRWLMSQFAVPGGATGYHQCIAISQTGDPTGAWYRYDFLASATKMNDYPKFGVWPDGYYMTANQFGSTGQCITGSQWCGAGAFAFERSRMLSGLSAQMIYFDLFSVDQNLGGMLPSHLNGSTAPPAGAPNYFVQFDDDGWGYAQDQLEIWQFHVDWTTPANSTFTGPSLLTTAAFDSNMCSYSRNCVPQPGTAVKVDAIADRLMYRLQYRNFGTYQAMVLNHTVDANGADRAGVRWYELQNSGSGWSIYQQGTYSPDSDNRWMGSIAMDAVGNIALGYSVSSSTTYPSIRYAGRLVSDTLGTLPQAEATIIAGTGSQTSSASRWGDYSSMSVDPSDDCTFWYTQEYYQTTSSSGWQTRIGSFKYPSCQLSCGNTTLTHSSSQAIVSGNSVSCNSGGIHTDNSYWRAFNLVDFGITGAFNVCEVQIGVELASSSGGTQPVTLRLYTSNQSFPTGYPGSLTQIGTVDTVIADQTLTVVGIPITVTVPASSELVVELFTPNGVTGSNSFYIGSNTAAETGPSYIMASDCGVTVPTAVASLGFPNMHIVKNVIGTPVLPSGTLQGTVTSAFTTKPIANAHIDLNPTVTTALTDASGFYQYLDLTATTYDVTASAYHYTANTVNGVSVSDGGTTTQDFVLACDVSFTDVSSGFWAENYIKEMYCRSITTGCSTSPLKYCPDNSVTRAQMAKFIIRGMGETPSAVAYNTYFDDVANDLAIDGFAGYINRMKELGITTGCGTRSYCPNNSITRGQVAKFVIRGMGETPSAVAYNTYFDDIANDLAIDGFAGYINRMKELGITTGCGTRLYCPNSYITRAQMAVFIIRAF